MSHRPALLLIPFLFTASPATTAQQNPLVGTWEEIDGRVDAEGRPAPTRANILIIGSDGYYMTSTLPPNRPKVNKPVAEMTRDELLARFGEVRGQRGVYSVSGDRLTTRQLGNVDPNEDGRQVVRVFRIDGDVLTLTAPNPAVTLQSRFRRLKPAQGSQP
jgi:hypothetical protein